MFRFSLAELMIVVTAVGVAAGGIALPADEHRAEALVAASMLGITIAGSPLLWWRRRSGTLVGRWGIGEIAWFWLGVYFAPLLFWSVVARGNRAGADHWLTVGFVMSAAVGATTLIMAGVRLLMRMLGTPVESKREWFVRRGTNWMGLAIVAINTCGIGTIVAMKNGWF